MSRKNMRRAMTLATLLLAAALLAGCGAFSSGNSQKSAIPDVRSGFDGLTFEFIKNAPPPQVFESSPFPALIRVKNSGAYSLPEGSGILSLGVERDYISGVRLETGSGSRVSAGGTDNEAQFSMEGRTIVNPKGDEEIISFTLDAGRIDPQSESHKSVLLATACYPYHTELVGSVCVDTDPYNLQPIRKSCSATNLNFANGQGGPVSVTSIEVLMLPSADKQIVIPQFLITVENKGKGEVASPQSYKDVCRRTPNSLTYKDFNVVQMKALLSNKELSCSLRDQTTTGGGTEQIVRLKSRKDVVRCVATAGIPLSQGSYTAPLHILLDYGYTHSISAEYLVRRPVR